MTVYAWSHAGVPLAPHAFLNGVWTPLAAGDEGESGPTGPQGPPRPYAMPTAPPYNVPVKMVIPTPDGTGSTTHPGVLDLKLQGVGSLGGFRYWMAITPYSASDDQKENPCILASNDGWYWFVPPGLTNPLDHPVTSPFPGGYNSDTDLVWDPEEERFVVTWRRVIGGSEVIHAAESKDGVAWTYHYNRVLNGRPAPTTASVVSPTIVRKGPNDWYLFATYAPSSDSSLDTYRSTSPLGPWTKTSRFETAPAGLVNLWHQQIIWYGGRFLGVFVNRAWSEHAGVSLDGITWKFGPAFLKEQTTYRASIQPDPADGEMNLWYSYNGNDENGIFNWWTKHTKVPMSLWTI